MTQATELRELASLITVSSSKVGVRTTSPSATLHINSQIGDNGGSDTTVDYPLVISQEDTNNAVNQLDGSGVGILFKNATNSTAEIGSAIASMRGSPSDDNTSAELAFFVSDNDTTLDEVVRINTSGYVGIGTTDPGALLDVTTTSGWAEVHFDGASGGDIILKDNGANIGEIYAGTGHGMVLKSYATQHMYFLTNAESSAKMIIQSGGNVGIGIDPPAHKLDVDGAIATRQVRHSISPTLNLDFANSKQLDSRITFYRDSVATYYSKEGKLMYATNNEPRFDHDPVTGESKGLLIEGTVTNSIVNSNPMRWTGNNAVYVVDNAAKAPDGTYSAVKIQDIASTNSIFHGTYQHVSVTNGVAYTISGYFKAGTEDVVGFRMYDGSSMAMRGHFNLNSGTPSLINGTSINMQDVGDGWYRCSIVGTATNTTQTADVYIFTTSVYTHTSTGDNSIYAWGIQHEASPVLSSYMPTDTKFSNRSTTASYYDKDGIVRYAPRDTPRYGYKYDGRKWVETGLITENAATNTVSYSHFQEGWSIPNVRHVYGEEITAPDGTTIRSVTANSTYNLIRQGNVFDNTTAGTATLSFWAKAISTTGNESITFDFGDMPGSGFNMASGLTSEWKRFTYTQSWTANQTIHNFLDFSMGNNTEIGLWGIQVETGSEATSYIPTYDTDAIRVADTVLSQNKTRTSDRAYIDGKHFEDFYNPDEGTMYIDYQLGAKLAQFRILALTKHNANTDFIEFIGGWGTAGATTGGVYMFGPNSTGSSVNTAGSTITNVAYERRKFAGRISHNDFYSVTQNSTSIAQAGDTDAGIPVVERLNFGDYNHTDSQKMFGHIRKVVYYPEALTNAELIALTENN